ncbi:hypothetical protein QR680_006539 [Steinernema hermaphroditum]|uniref:HEAT repeat-containing protein 1 n=1 Tax=Steinernema hermaphroditum TaxID=289476 RepID=A0AA39LXB3_9BILA|nr:hypothetical protein QR680_006539 [Steinernema hermaphroditum]
MAMTSLSRQLENLRTAATSSLAAQRVRKVNLLFLGLKGYNALCKIDRSLEGVAPEFFEESALQFQRGQLTAEENKALDEKIECFLLRLCPYAQHFACHEVLEWLIHRYEIHSYNTELVLKTFLPFHSSNFFGRLIHILDIKKTSEWAWLKSFADVASPVPLNKVVKESMRVSSSILNVVTNRIVRALELLGEEFVAKRLNVWFAFYTQLLLKMFQDTSAVTDQVISKAISSIALGLKSSISSFRHGALAAVCQLAMAVPLTEAVSKILLKACLMKLRSEWMESSLCAVIILCQRQSIKEFSRKSLLKIIRKEQYQEVCKCLKEIAAKADLTKFLAPLWKTLFDIIIESEQDAEERKQCYAFIEMMSEPTAISNRQAAKFFSIFVQHFADLGDVKLPKSVRKNTRALVLRFTEEFNVVRAEWLVRDPKLVPSLLDQCKVTEDEIGAIDVNRKRRRRRSTLRKSICEDPTMEFDINKNTVVSRDEAKRTNLAQTQVPIASKKPFKDTLSTVIIMLKNEKWDEVRWAFASINDKYLKDEDTPDINAFVRNALTVGARHAEIKNDVRSLLSTMEIAADFYATLLVSVPPSAQPKRKNAKVTEASAELPEPSTSTDRLKLVELALEVLILNKRIRCSQALLRRLFTLQNDAIDRRTEESWSALQQLSIQCLIRLLKNPGSYKITTKDLALDPIIQGIRTTDDHRFLRDALKLLTAAVSINSVTVLKQVMSVFTFMGSGLLKKDNEVTLEILEETLNVLFKAVFNDVESQAGRDRLLSLSRILAVSLGDIPAHRRMRIVEAIGRSVGSKYIWVVLAVLFDEFCQKWQRPAGGEPKDNKHEGEMFDDMATEMISSYEPEAQLQAAVDLLSYVVRLGGDQPGAVPAANELFPVFDRSANVIQKLRHFRFSVFGWVAKFLTFPPLFEKLAALDDDEIYARFMQLGKKLLSLAIELDEFVSKQVEFYERDFMKRRRDDPEAKAPQTLKYWIALSARSDTVSERFRNLLPASVSGRLIGDILADDKTDHRIRDKALQLLNTKMMQDTIAIEAAHLLGFVEKLNAWLKPAESKEEVAQCQSAAFSLKLIAKRIPTVGSTNLLSTTMGRCGKIVKGWEELDEAMVGSVLLLCGELIRSHNMRSTMLSAESLLTCCLDILKEAYSRPLVEEPETDPSTSARRKRVASRSLCGKHYSSDVLLVCALTCLQRIVDQFAAFITPHFARILNLVSCLSAKYDPDMLANDSNLRVSASQHRLRNIRKAFVRIELRLLFKPVSEALKSLINKPREMMSLFQIFGDVIDSASSKEIKKNLDKFVEIFFAAFEGRKHESVSERFELITKCESTVIGVFLKLVDSMSDSEVKPVMESLVKWGASGLSADAPLANRMRLITVFHFANKFYDSYHSLALPYFSSLFDLCPKVLIRVNTAKTEEKKLLFACLKNSHPIEKLSANEVITQVLTLLTNCSKHSDFFVRERADAVYESVVDELENAKCHGHEERCVPLLADCLYQIAEAHTQLFTAEMNTRIMLKTRNSSHKIRYRSLIVIDRLLDRIGESVAPLLPNILPFLSELLEDDNRKVEEQCDKTIRMLRTKFGSEFAAESTA